MAVTQGSRFGLTRWSDDNDEWDRSQWDSDNDKVETFGLIGRQGTTAQRGTAAAWPRSLYFNTTTFMLSYSDGVAWRDLAGAPAEYFPRWTTVDAAAGSLTVNDGYMYLVDVNWPAGFAVNNMTLALPDGEPDVDVDNAWIAIYDSTGAKKAVAVRGNGFDTLSAGTTSTFNVQGGPFYVPTSGRYTLGIVLNIAAGAAQTHLLAAPTSTDLGCKQVGGGSTYTTPASAPANLSGSYVPTDRLPWVAVT